jgi:hypothetical protein
VRDRFEPGEVVIIQNAPAFNGLEAVVILGYGLHLHAIGTKPPRYDYGYCIRLDKEERFAFPHQLRKKRPPEETTTWDKCEWRPKGVMA